MNDPSPAAPQKTPIVQTANVLSSTNLAVISGSVTNTQKVDLVVIGSGPASLGLMVAAVKKSKFHELIQDDGVAILDAGMSFGGGMLCNYGINSNTSANSFLKCIFRKAKDSDKQQQASNLILQNAPKPLNETKNKTKNQITQPQVSVSKVNLTVPLGKDSAKTNDRLQKSLVKERVNQH